MISKATVQVLRRVVASYGSTATTLQRRTFALHHCTSTQRLALPCRTPKQIPAFHTSSCYQAQSPTADAVMESLTELYATAKDEFEIAAEETEKKTVYAADDREAAQEALQALKEAFEKAVKESHPEVGKEIQSRVGQRIRELENAVKAVEELAQQD